MIIATLSMKLPAGQEAETIRTLRTFWDSTCALPGCIGGGVYQEIGFDRAALYLEIWSDSHQLEVHIRSQGYALLLAVMETSPEAPALGFQFVVETRGLEWVEKLRLGGGPYLTSGWHQP
jgi:quinol monooxygenase YgiN